MRILFLPDLLRSRLNDNVIRMYLDDYGYDIIKPNLDDDDFGASVRTAQAEYELHRPDLIVGSSRGGVVAMNMQSGDTPLVLLRPAWRRWGTATTVKANTVILHSAFDRLLPVEESEQLVQASGLPVTTLIMAGQDPRLTDSISLEWILDMCRDDRYHAIHEAAHVVMFLEAGITPTRVAIGRHLLGTFGRTEHDDDEYQHCSSEGILRMKVAGYLGTRLNGYHDLTVSEKLEELEFEEPPYGSDEWWVWGDAYSLAEVLTAESDALAILKSKQDLVIALADEILARRDLGADDIQAVVRAFEVEMR